MRPPRRRRARPLPPHEKPGAGAAHHSEPPRTLGRLGLPGRTARRGDSIGWRSILQIADIYDALTTARPYKPAFPAAQALSMLEDEVALGWRDPKLVAAFQQLHRNGLTDAYSPMLLQWSELELLSRSVSGTLPIPPA